MGSSHSSRTCYGGHKPFDVAVPTMVMIENGSDTFEGLRSPDRNRSAISMPFIFNTANLDNHFDLWNLVARMVFFPFSTEHCMLQHGTHGFLLSRRRSLGAYP